MFTKRGESLIKGVRSLENILCAVGCGVYLLLMLIGAGDVIGRYVFNRPIKGTLEFSELMIAVIVFLGWGYVQRERGHVRLDFVVNRFPRKAQIITDLVTSFLFFAVSGLIVWRAVLIAINDLREGIVLINPVVMTPTAPFNFLVAFGGGIVCLELIIQIVEQIRKMRGGG
jgi:TRAP-type C4-dicarboxylate transport system permease small subunit